MKLLSWNYNGLGNPLIVKALQDWCWRDRPNIVFVMETKIDAKKLELVHNRCGFSDGLRVDSNGRSGGMGLWWQDMDVKICLYSAHHIEVDVCDQLDNSTWKAVGVYGWVEMTNKHYTWELMRIIKSGCAVPLLMFGDFNEILGIHEKEGGVARAKRYIDAFRDAIRDCECRDLGYKGNMFTWQRGNSIETVVCERLDRCIAYTAWCTLFEYLEVLHLPICHLYHAPILLNFDMKSMRKSHDKMFRFESLWLSNDECKRVVEEAWSSGGSDLIHTRLKLVVGKLISWAAATFGVIKKKIKKEEKRLRELQRGRLDANLLTQCKEMSMELQDLRSLEESYWHARARANEMRDGDKNTSHFHHKASQRK